jgi:hypothetical protein
MVKNIPGKGPDGRFRAPKVLSSDVHHSVNPSEDGKRKYFSGNYLTIFVFPSRLKGEGWE